MLKFCLLNLVLVLAFTMGCGPSAQQLQVAQQRTEQVQAEAQRIHYKAAIETALRQDAATGSIRDLDKHVVAMQQIDTSDCPSNFRTAYLDHTYAWEYPAKVHRARVELASDGSIQDTLVRSILSAANNSSDTPIADLLRSDQQLKQLEATAVDKISDTFHGVERIAVAYGAVLPASK